jgi:nucleoside-diphosphate-sugar epimerase
MPINILISGASGFIGRNFTQKISPKFATVPVSLSKTPVGEIDFKNINVVLHLSALVHQMQGAPEEQYFKINSDLAYDFAKRAKEQGVSHFIFISTAKVFGESTSPGLSFTENSPCNPQDAYAKSKLQAEERIKTLESDTFVVSIIRIPLVYGNGVKGNLQSIIGLVKTFPILPLAGISNKRTLLYVGTLVDMVAEIIEQKKAGLFIACDSESLSTTQLVEEISKAFNKKTLLFKLPYFVYFILTKIKPDITDRLYGSFQLDNSESRKMLNFTSRYSIAQGIKEMIE